MIRCSGSLCQHFLVGIHWSRTYVSENAIYIDWFTQAMSQLAFGWGTLATSSGILGIDDAGLKIVHLD